MIIKFNLIRLSFLKHFHNYFDSEWSYTKLKLPDKNAKVAFDPLGKGIFAVSTKGQYYLISYDQDSEGKLLKTNSISSRLF